MNLLPSVVSGLALSLLASCAAVCTAEPSNHGPMPFSKNGYQEVDAHADAGFYAFSFGAAKTYAYQSFSFKLRNSGFLSITDCFCPGDTFQIYDNGIPLAITKAPENGPFPCQPPYYMESAWQCMVGEYHAKASVILNPGHHNITVAAVNSAVGGGTGFLRIDTSCTPPNTQPYPCCWIEEADNPQTDYEWSVGRLCNQMVTYP